MIEWLLASLDPSRAHEVSEVVAWHARLMTLAWGMLIPLGVLIARFFKITPGQDWPRHVDNRFWWHSHLMLQYSGGVLTLVALGLILAQSSGAVRWGAHGLFGYAVVLLALTQFLGAWLRGTRGGPTDGSLRGDHYDMTPRRRLFEWVHKSAGYLALLVAAAAILTGLWTSNAPRWMWIGLLVWWLAFVAAFIALQRRGFAVDTYQALWGPDPKHPGNAMKPIGWGLRRLPQSPGER